jgi:cell division protein FtsQ
MPRKDYERPGRLPGMDADPRPPARPRARPAPPPRREVPTARIVMLSICAAVLLVTSTYAFHEFEQFLIRDTRFALNGADGSWDTSTLEIAGATHASRHQLEMVFAEDSGRSVYLLPMSDRRTSLRAVSWVRDASIERMWPNRVVVRIAERAPVAFVALAPSHFGLIDEDGVILPPAPDRFTLPVLGGVHASDPIEERRKRVHRMLRLTHDLGNNASKISQVDASDPDNLKITQPWDGHVLTLLMGDHDFAQRYANFVRSYPEIKRSVPGAATIDLRLGDRITVVE